MPAKPFAPTTPNKERIRLLVNALRSGKFRQGRETLARFDARQKRYKYCCLGVACEVAKANGLPLRRESATFGGEKTLEFDYDRTFLPRSVQDWFGFDRDDPFLATGLEFSASDCNDGLKWPFRKIADAFENLYLRDDDDHDTETTQ